MKPPAPQAPSKTPARRRGRPHGRRPLPAHLPRYRLEHPVAPGDLTCPCGCARRRIGEEVTEQLDTHPASLFVLQHVRPKYACTDPACIHSPAVVIADKPPQPIEKGLPGPGLIAHVITSKYADHQPLYRLEGILARHGVDLDRSTLGGWVEAAADLLLPLYAFMVSLVLGSRDHQDRRHHRPRAGQGQEQDPHRPAVGLHRRRHAPLRRLRLLPRPPQRVAA